jgi:hypothetical protein
MAEGTYSRSRSLYGLHLKALADLLNSEARRAERERLIGLADTLRHAAVSARSWSEGVDWNDTNATEDPAELPW